MLSIFNLLRLWAVALVFFSTLASSTLFADGDFSTSCQVALISPWLPPIPISTPSNTTYLLAQAISSINLKGSRSGKIVVFDENWRGVELVDDLLEAQSKGAVAVVLSSAFSEPGRAIWTVKERYKNVPTFRRDIRIPVVQVSMTDCDSMILPLQKDFSLNTTLTIDSNFVINSFSAASDSPISALFQAGVIVPAGGGLVFSLYRLGSIVRVRGWEWRLPNGILLLESLSHLLRIIWALDPFGLRSLYDPFSVAFLYTPHAAVCLFCDLAILFYWNNAMRALGTKSIDWAKKYAYLLIALIAILEIISSILRGLELSFLTYVFVPILYLLIELLVIAYIIYTSVGIFKFFQQSKKLDATQETSKEKILRMTKLLVASASFLLVLVVLSALALVPFFFDGANKQMLFWWLIMTFVTAIGICQSLIFRHPSSSGKRKGSHGTSAVTLRRKGATVVTEMNASTIPIEMTMAETAEPTDEHKVRVENSQRHSTSSNSSS